MGRPYTWPAHFLDYEALCVGLLNLIVHFALFNCADTLGPILLRFHSKTMQDLRCKTSNFVNSLLFIVVYHKRALQRLELQLFETKIITLEKVRSDDKRLTSNG